ncbi:MAG TPA: uroporphyrinogen decarboxylase family protein [Planctomycetota bacterium]|jgi:uroporphyrinogen decarboxylase
MANAANPKSEIPNPQSSGWIEQVLAHRQPAAVPYNFMFSPPARQSLLQHYGLERGLEDFLEFPIRMTAPKSIKPLYADPDHFGETVTDEFGVVWTTSKIDRGSPVGPSLKEASLRGFQFPDPAAAYRFEDMAKFCAREAGHYRIVWVGDLWERATFMRGMDSILMDWVLEPAFVDELLRRLTDHILATMRILFGRFQFEGVALSDDYGTQRGLLMSPADWRARIKPLLREIYALAKQNGRTVFHHSCGCVRAIVPDLIEIGLDILHPIQPETMDIFELKREFGRDLTFCGGVGTQELLPFGAPEQIRAEVRKLKREMGAGGGYILEPGITLQADVPLANLVALIEEARA